MKKNEKLLFAIGDIDDCMVDAAYNKENNKKSRSGVFEIIGTVAAVAAIAVFAVVLSHFAQKKPNISAGTDAVTGDGITTVTDDNKTTVTDDGIIDSIKDDNVELINIKDIKEISGDYHYVSVGEREWESVTIGMTLSEILNSDVVSYNLPSLMPEGYILLHTGMDVANDHIENSRSLTLIFIDNVNNAVEEHRDESGNVIYNKDKYNSLTLFLYNKSKYEGIEHITKKWLLTKSLSAEYLYKDFYEENADGHTEYTFLIETDEYYILYEYRGCEGGERDLNCNNLYRIAASTPYIKDNGYKYTGDEIKARDGVFMTAEELEGVTAIHVTSLPGSYDFRYEGAAEVNPITVYLSSLHASHVSEDGVDHTDGMTWVTELKYGDGTAKTIYLFGNYIRRYDGALYELDDDEASELSKILKGKGQPSGDGLSKVVFMTEEELEGVTAVHVTSEPGGYDFSFNGKDEVKPIVDYLSSLHPARVSEDDVDPIYGMTWVTELKYGDGTVKTVYQIANKYMSKGNGVLYELDIEEASKFDRIVKGTALPGDFSFFIVWNTYGISSYDSKTGDLIKDNNASDVSKYMTTYKLTDAELERVYRALAIIDDLPDEYDPYNDPSAENKISSKPSQTIMVTVTKNGKTKTVTCENVCLSGEGYDDNAKTFLLAVDVIKSILTNTKAWQKLPDYEFYYD
jgi:hypothetical protein